MRLTSIASLALLLGFVAEIRAEGPHRLGVGANYFVAMRDLEAENVEEDGFGYFLSYQYRPQGPLGLEADIEMLPDGFAASNDNVYAPQAYIILGSYIYVAAGIGGYYTDGELANDPFYAARIGADMDFAKVWHLDLYTTYRFENWDDLSDSDKDVGSDTLFLGSAIRLGF